MHKCQRCGYSFPDAQSLDAHLEGGCTEEDGS